MPHLGDLSATFNCKLSVREIKFGLTFGGIFIVGLVTLGPWTLSKEPLFTLEI